MCNETLLDTLSTTHADSTKPVLTKNYYFHDIRIRCLSNDLALFEVLDKLLGIFDEPDSISAEAHYYIFSYHYRTDFPWQLPRNRVRTETTRLLTNTKLKYYRSKDNSTQFQSFEANPPINQFALSVINQGEKTALTQLEMPEQYQATFLRRYVMLLALGELMQQFGFDPCHAAAITAPFTVNQGALIIGSSGSGKTTLSIGSALAGYGLLGDDLVMLREDGSGQIGAYAISHEVAVRSGSIELWPELSYLKDLPADERDKRYCSIEHLHAGGSRIQTPITMLLFPVLTSSSKSGVTPLNKASVLQKLVAECLGKKNVFPQEQERLFKLLSSLAEQAKGYQLDIARGSHDGPLLIGSLFKGEGI